MVWLFVFFFLFLFLFHDGDDYYYLSYIKVYTGYFFFQSTILYNYCEDAKPARWKCECLFIISNQTFQTKIHIMPGQLLDKIPTVVHLHSQMVLGWSDGHPHSSVFLWPWQCLVGGSNNPHVSLYKRNIWNTSIHTY